MTDLNQFPPAKITDRFLAYLFDLAPFVGGYYATLYLLIFRFAKWPNAFVAQQRVFFAWLGLYLVYQVLGNMSGGTFGKRIFGIGILGPDNGTLNFGRSVVRAAGYLLSTPLCNLGFLWSFVDRDSRCWHDLLAGSRVVELSPKPAGVKIVTAAAAFLALGGIFAADAWFYLYRATPVDRAAILKAEEGLKVLAGIEESYKAKHGGYTDKLVELAHESGDVKRFRSAMVEIFDADGFVLSVEPGRYLLRARALDSRRTVVELAGPKEL